MVTENGQPGGEPLHVYHGSAASFTVFDKARRGSATGDWAGGFYFTSNSEEAKGYAAEAGGDHVYDGYLRMEAPFDTHDLTAARKAMKHFSKEIDAALAGPVFNGDVTRDELIEVWDEADRSCDT